MQIKTVFTAPEKDALEIIFDKDVFDRATLDGDPSPEEAKRLGINFEQHIYAVGYVNGEAASLFLVEGGEKLYFYVLKPFRAFARVLLNEALKVYKKPLVVEIPTLYRGAINFAKKAGFKLIAVKEKAAIKNGKPYDVEVLLCP